MWCSTTCLPVSHIYPRAALDAGFSDYEDAIAAKRTDSLTAVSCQSLLLSEWSFRGHATSLGAFAAHEERMAQALAEFLGNHYR